ncbi:MAG: hypothetical protein J6K28_06230 [Alistipes sp.]|nr:hypothetical protein [Alistipes sp.]
MYSISSQLYEETARRLRDAIGGRSYFSGSLDFVFEDTECRLTLSAVIYTSRREMPEGAITVIDDIVPVWWEFRTSDENGEMLNDFSFSALKELFA